MLGPQHPPLNYKYLAVQFFGFCALALVVECERQAVGCHQRVWVLGPKHPPLNHKYLAEQCHGFSVLALTVHCPG